MSSTSRRKGKANTKVSKKKKAKIPYSLRKEYKGLSGVGTYIENNKDFSPELGNMVLLEPREWLDYACVGVTHSGEQVHAVYDLNILECIYAIMYAYDEFNYEGPGMKWYRIYKSITGQHVDDAREWVAYNTIRGAEYVEANRPLFIRSHSEIAHQIEWVG